MSCSTDSSPVLTVGELDRATVEQFLTRFSLSVEWIADNSPITGSFWGEPEAGIVGTTVFLRADTPVHSMLHEVCHIICMPASRRATLYRNAGGDDLEESAVCYLQVVLGDELAGVGSERIAADMDSWGYSFRLGNTAIWFTRDAEDAREWLISHNLLSASQEPIFQLRQS